MRAAIHSTVELGILSLSSLTRYHLPDWSASVLLKGTTVPSSKLPFCSQSHPTRSPGLNLFVWAATAELAASKNIVAVNTDHFRLRVFVIFLLPNDKGYREMKRPDA